MKERLLLIIAVFVAMSFVSLSAQEREVKIERFDKAFYDYLQKPTKSAENKLRADYPELLPAFMQIAQGANSQTVDMATIRQYFSHRMLKIIYKDEQLILADLSTNEKALTKASKLVEEYFPKKGGLPRFAIHVSGFKENVIVLDGLISISGDKYLGENYPVYIDFFNEEERPDMKPQAITYDLLKAWTLSEKIVRKDNPETLMSAMIEKGKILFLLSKLLPDYGEEYILRIDADELKHLDKKKSTVWNKIMRNNLLMSTDKVMIAGYIEDHISAMKVLPYESYHMGIVFGWDIVRQYVQKTNSTVQQVLDADATHIMKTVRYNP